MRGPRRDHSERFAFDFDFVHKKPAASKLVRPNADGIRESILMKLI